MNLRISFAVASWLALSASSLAQTFFGPTPYLQLSDSPFWGLSGLQVEDVEDHSFDLPGAASDFALLSSAFGSGLVDSVDADDGAIDGFGNNGDALWGSGQITIGFGVNSAALPRYAGLVWTDGAGTILFEAWGENGQYLGSVAGDHADSDFGGGTAEDRFYGVSYAGGISQIRISNTAGGTEADHIQFAAVPEPTSLCAVAIGAIALVRRRRAK